MTATPFFDADAEQDVVGACIVSRTAIDAVVGTLLPTDFGSPHACAAFAAAAALHGRGVPIDVTSVTDELTRAGAGWHGASGDLLRWASEVPSPGNARHYAAIVARYSARRRLHGVAVELAEATGDPTQEPEDLLDATRARLAALDAPALTSTLGDVEIGDLLAEDEDDQAPPVIPGLLAEDDRAVIVAPEGSGKSELARQLVVLAAHGVDPLHFGGIEPVPTLLVDLENPRALVRQRLRRLTAAAALERSGERAPCSLWHRPGGIDVRKRTDRLALEDVLRRRRPKLVAVGPVYKCYTRGARETDEQVAAEVQAIIDDLRTRYGFATVLEHHAGQAHQGIRDLRPFGSSLWLRWPEFGLKLTPDRERPGSLTVGRWRGDRAEAAWPDRLERGDTFPWVGVWKHGVPTRRAMHERSGT